MTQTVVITGITGLLGQFLGAYLSQRSKVIGISSTPSLSLKGFETFGADLSDEQTTKKLFSEIKPDIVIHTAGLTSVDLCEDDPALAKRMNVDMTENILQAIDAKRTRFVHLSTDHVFSGEQKNYREDSPTEPLNVYARTKLQAEAKVAAFKNSVALRTNFYGGKTGKKKSFSNWIFDELKANRSLRVFDDVFFTPISVCSLAENIELIMNSKLTGIYNVVGSERVTKYEFACRLAHKFDLNPQLIIRSKVEDVPLKAKRPNDMSLSIAKAVSDLPGFVQENVDQGLEKIRKQNLI